MEYNTGSRTFISASISMELMDIDHNFMRISVRNVLPAPRNLKMIIQRDMITEREQELRDMPNVTHLTVTKLKQCVNYTIILNDKNDTAALAVKTGNRLYYFFKLNHLV